MMSDVTQTVFSSSPQSCALWMFFAPVPRAAREIDISHGVLHSFPPPLAHVAHRIHVVFLVASWQA